MPVKIAKIVKSNSHVDYVGRIIDALDSDAPPQSADYGFAQFVAMPLEDRTEVIGVIYDSQLANPDYASFGPRLSPRADLSVLSPDYLNEQGVLVGILLLGWRDAEKKIHQSVPRRVVPANQDVYRVEESDVHSFHRNARGEVQLHYYSQITTHAGAFAVALLEAILEQLDEACSHEEKQRLCVLKQTLQWQRTVGGMRI